MPVLDAGGIILRLESSSPPHHIALATPVTCVRKPKANEMETHERLTGDEPGEGGSDRGFGIVFAFVFAAIGLFPQLGGGPPRGWALGVAATLLAVALAKPALLAPFNRVWFKFGLLLQRVVNPLVMALIYYAVVTPTGLVMRVFGKDPLRLKHDPDAGSYWIHRDPPGPERESMNNQF